MRSVEGSASRSDVLLGVPTLGLLAPGLALGFLGRGRRWLLVVLLAVLDLPLVGASAVMRDVHTNNLLLLGHAEQARDLERAEEHDAADRDPGEDGEQRDDLRAEQPAAAAVEAAPVLAAGVGEDEARGLLVVRARVAVGGDSVGARAEEAGGQEAPHAADHVHGRGVERVVDPHHLEDVGGAVVQPAGDHTDEQAGEGLCGRHAGAGRHEAREDAVEHRRQVDGHAPDEVDHHHAASAAGGGERRDDRDLGGDVPEAAAERQGRARVETVPAEPHDEHAERGDGQRVRHHAVHLAGRAEPADARPEDPRRPERGGATGHVHDAGAGEVDDAVEEVVADALARAAVARVRGHEEGRQPALAGPHPVHDDGVHERDQEDVVDQVPDEAAALRDGTAHDGGRGGRERPLEHPEGVAAQTAAAEVPQLDRVARLLDGEFHGVELGQEEVVRADPAVAVVETDAEGEGEAERPPNEGADARVEKVLEKDVLRVLRADGAGL
mmetsp:Transcript_9903/g.40923  ORF Transcript_9903/g.40923 Transcript_9903/m.40923 type:complete len:497 (+) Transcript_9903:174-1664(+)